MSRGLKQSDHSWTPRWRLSQGASGTPTPRQPELRTGEREATRVDEAVGQARGRSPGWTLHGLEPLLAHGKITSPGPRAPRKCAGLGGCSARSGPGSPFLTQQRRRPHGGSLLCPQSWRGRRPRAPDRGWKPGQGGSACAGSQRLCTLVTPLQRAIFSTKALAEAPLSGGERGQTQTSHGQDRTQCRVKGPGCSWPTNPAPGRSLYLRARGRGEECGWDQKTRAPSPPSVPPGALAAEPQEATAQEATWGGTSRAWRSRRLHSGENATQESRGPTALRSSGKGLTRSGS